MRVHKNGEDLFLDELNRFPLLAFGRSWLPNGLPLLASGPQLAYPIYTYIIEDSSADGKVSTGCGSSKELAR